MSIKCLIGKTIFDKINKWIEIGNKPITITPEVNWEQIERLKSEIASCNTTVEIDAVVHNNGFGNVNGLTEYIDELHKNGQLNNLTPSNLKNFIETAQLKDVANQAHGFKGVNDAIKEYNKLLGDSSNKAKDFSKFVQVSNSNLGSYLSTVKDGKASWVGYGLSLVGAKAQTIALQAASIALNTALSMGIGIILSLATTAITNWINRVNNAKEALDEFNDVVKEGRDELDSQKEWIDRNGKKYEELSKGVDKLGHNISLTTDEYAEYNSMTKEIEEMFPSLVQGHNDQQVAILNEKGSVDELTNAYKENTEAYWANIRAKGGKTFSKFNTAIEDDKDDYDELSKLLSEDGYTFSRGKRQIYFANAFRGILSDDIITQMQDEINAMVFEPGKEANIKISDFSQEVQQAIRDAYAQISQTINDQATKVRPIAEAYLHSAISGFDKLSPELQAVAKNFINNIDGTFYTQFNGNYLDMEEWIKQNVIIPLQDGADDQDIAIKFQSLFTLDQSQYKSYKDYVDAVKKKIAELRQLTDKNGNSVFTEPQLNTLEQRMGVSDYDTSGNVTGEALIKDVKEKFSDIAGFEKYIEGLTEEGLRKLHGMTDKELDNTKKLYAKFGKDINSLSIDDLKIAAGLKIDDDTLSSWDKLISKIEEAKSKMGDTSSKPVKFTKANWESFVASDSENQKTFENLTKLAEQGKLTIKVFEDTPNKQNILDHFGVSAEEAVDKLNSFIDRADQLSALGSNIRSLSDNLGSKKENPNQGITSDVLAGMSDSLKECTKEWAEYERVMMDANSTYADCEKATNALATALLNNGNYLAGLTKETEQAYISDLKAMGVMNAEAIVTDMLTQKTAKLRAEKEWDSLTSEQRIAVMNGEIEGLAKEKGWSDEVTLSIKRLVFEKQLFNQNALDTSASIENLRKLAIEANASADVIYNLGQLQNAMNQMKLHPSQDFAQQMEEYRNKIKSLQENPSALYADTKKTPEIEVNISPVNSKSPSSKNSNSTKSKAKETKTTIDWIARSLKVLQDKIDLTKAKFDNLFTFKEKKNNIKQQIKETKTLIEQTQRAIKAYGKEANKAFSKIKSGKFTVTSSSKSGNDLVSIAEKELGYHEGKGNNTKYGKYTGANFAAWCQSFVSWVANKAGLSTKQSPKTASTDVGMNFFKKQGNFGYKGKYTPKRNDIVYFKSAGRSHTGIVSKVKNGRVYTIEGNSSDKVRRRSYSLNDKTITGYGKTSKYFSGNTTQTVKLSKEQINYIKQLVTNGNVTSKALAKSMVIKKYGEKEGEKINAYIDQFDNVQSLKKSLQEYIKDLREERSQLYQLYVDRADSKKEYLEAEIESTTSASRKNNYLNKEISQIKTSYKYQIKQAKLEEDWVKVATLRLQKESEILEIQKQQIQNIQDQVEAENDLLEVKNQNADNRTKKTNLNKESSNLLSANKDIEKNLKKDTTSSQLFEDTKEITRAKMSAKGAELSTDITVKNVKLSKSNVKKIKAILQAGQRVPSKWIKKIRKVNPDLAKKLEDYNKLWNDVNKLDKEEREKDLTDTANTQIENNIATAREKRSEAIQVDIDASDSAMSELEARYDNLTSLQEKSENIQERVEEAKLNSGLKIAQIENDIQDEGLRSIQILEEQERIAKELRELRSEDIQNYITRAEDSISALAAEGDNLTTAKNKIKNIDLQMQHAEVAHYKRIEQLKNDILDKDELRAKLAEENAKYEKETAQYLKDQFDAINHELSNKNGLWDNAISHFESLIDLFEARGDAINTDIYREMMEYTKSKNENDMLALKDLEEKLPTLKGDDWYSAMNDYVTLAKSVQENQKQIVEWQKAINEIELKPFEKLSNKISFLNDEFEFMLKVVQDGRKLFDEDTGAITEAGLASFQIYFDQIGLCEEECENLKRKMAKVQKQYDSGAMSLEDYEEKMEELTREIWNQKEAYLGIKDAIIDMVKDTLDAQLTALDKMIDKYKKALANEKDLYEYQRNIAKQTKNIVNIQKQIAALSGDGSEEARSKIQKLKLQLEEAQDELKDTEYNRWYEDQTNMLDNLRDEIAEAFDNIMKDTDAIIESLAPHIKVIGDHTRQFLDRIDYDVTPTMKQILDNQDTMSAAFLNGETLVRDAITTVVGDLRSDIERFYNTVPTVDELRNMLVPLFESIEQGNADYGNGNGGNGQEDYETNVPDTSTYDDNSSSNSNQNNSSNSNQNNSSNTNRYTVDDLMAYITSNSQYTNSNTPTTGNGHNLNNYLNNNYGQALTADKESVVYDMIKNIMGLPSTYSEEMVMQRAVVSGLLAGLRDLFNDDPLSQSTQDGRRITGDDSSSSNNSSSSSGSSSSSSTITASTPQEARLVRAIDVDNRNRVSNAIYDKVDKYLNKKLLNVENQNSDNYKSAKSLMTKYKSAARIYHTWDSKFALTNESELEHIAKLMGAIKSNGKIDDTLLYKKLVASGFKTGGIAKVVKRTGEDGIGLFRNGEGFVMPEHVPQIQELLKNIPQANMIMEDLNRKFAFPVSGKNGNVGGTTIGDVNMYIEGSNVVDAQTFMDALDNAQVKRKVVSMVGNQMVKPYMNTLSKF